MVAAGGYGSDWPESAVVLLGEMQTWRMAEHQWDRVARIVQEIEIAVSSGQDLAAERSVIELELAGPFRAVRAGSARGVPMPGPLRERSAELIHTLQARSAANESAHPELPLPDEQTGAAQ